MKRLALAFLLSAQCGLAAAQTGAPADPPGSLGEQRAAITAERSRLERDFLTQEAACYEKFAVNSCLEKVNTARRQAMASLRRQEIELNDEARKARGADQLRRIQDKSSPEKLQENAARRARALEDYQARVAREKDNPPGGLRDKATDEAAARQAQAARQLAQQRQAQARAARQAAAAEEARKSSARQQQAQERRARRQADQATRAKPSAKPLPIPE